MTASYLVFTGIAPHPPIMVPEVGREAAGEVRGSIEAMREFTRRLIESGAETVVLISPHAPLDATGLYSVASYLVMQRRHDIGVRIAIGASPGDMARQCVGEAGRWMASGTVAGRDAAWPTTLN